MTAARARFSVPYWWVSPEESDSAQTPQLVTGWVAGVVVLRWWGLQSPRPERVRVRVVGPVDEGVWEVRSNGSLRSAEVVRVDAASEAQEVSR